MRMGLKLQSKLQDNDYYVGHGGGRLGSGTIFNSQDLHVRL